MYSLVATDGMSAVLTDDAGADPIPGFPVIRHQASGAGAQSDTMPLTATRISLLHGACQRKSGCVGDVRDSLDWGQESGAQIDAVDGNVPGPG